MPEVLSRASRVSYENGKLIPQWIPAFAGMTSNVTLLMNSLVRIVMDLNLG